MKPKLLWLSILIIALLLVSCGPSEGALQESSAQTQTAQATKKHTPEPTFTHTLQPSSTPTITQTFTPTVEPITIVVPPEDLMLVAEDLPPDAEYTLNTAGGFPYQFDSGLLGEAEGRVDGWMTDYRKGENDVIAPAAYSSMTIQYETKEQALNDLVRLYQEYQTNYEGGFAIYHGKNDLGDESIVFKLKFYPPSDDIDFGFTIITAYRNYLFSVTGMGLEYGIDLADVKLVAETALEKIKAAPLGNW